MPNRPPAAALMLGLALLIAGCGGGSGSASDEEALARGAVADYMAAVVRLDPAGSCEALTAHAQDVVAQAVSDAPNIPNADDCVPALEGLWEGAVPLTSAEEAEASVQDIRDGATDITTSIDAGTGTVTLSRDLQVEVEKVDGTWLVSNGTPVLFSFGVDEAP